MSVAICNPAQLEHDMVNELELGPGLRRLQRKYFVVAPGLLHNALPLNFVQSKLN